MNVRRWFERIRSLLHEVVDSWKRARNRELDADSAGGDTELASKPLAEPIPFDDFLAQSSPAQINAALNH